MTASAADERERLEVIALLAYGERTPTSRIWYPLYVTALFAALYGISVSQGVFAALGTGARWWMVGSLAAAVPVALLALSAVGAVRGPVVPDLGFVDLVLPTDTDRAGALLPWWRAAWVACGVVGGIGALVITGGAAIRGVMPPVTPVVGTVLGVLIGLLAAHVWLRGQARPEPPVGESTSRGTREVLRRLGGGGLRAQALVTRSVTAATYAGDLGSLRQQMPAGRARQRGRRLRAAGAVGTLLRADLLMLRRNPWSVLTGAVLTAIGVALAVAALSERGLALALPPALVLTSMGAGQFLRGLHAHADGLANPSLLGLGGQRAALVHSVVGLVPVAALWLVGVALRPGLERGSALVAAAATVLVVLAAQVLGAYRGAASIGERSGPETIGKLLVVWVLLPYLVPLGVGALGSAAALRGAWAPGVLAAGAAVSLLVALGQMRRRMSPIR